MVLRPDYMLGHSEFNEFLYAVVGEEKNGMRLTVLTALARIGLDPWREASRLSDLSKEEATRALAAIINRLPEGDWIASDSWAVADRLVQNLPGRGLPAAGSPQEKYLRNAKPKMRVPKWLFWLALGAAVYFALSRFYDDRVSQSDRNDAWSQTRNVATTGTVGGVQLVWSGRDLTTSSHHADHIPDDDAG